MHHGPHNANHHHHHHHHGSPVPEELYLAFHARILETEVISECAAVERQYIDARTAHAQQATVVQEDADGCTGTVHSGGGGRGGEEKAKREKKDKKDKRDTRDTRGTRDTREEGKAGKRQNHQYTCRWGGSVEKTTTTTTTTNLATKEESDHHVPLDHVPPELPLLMPFLWDPRYLSTQHLTICVHASGEAR